MTMKFMSFFSLSLPPSLTLSLFYASRIPAKPPSLAVREKRARNEKKKTLDNFSTTADGSRASPTITILCHIERNLMGTWKKKKVLLYGLEKSNRIGKQRKGGRVDSDCGTQSNMTDSYVRIR
jgi:hypothetical protein